LTVDRARVRSAEAIPAHVTIRNVSKGELRVNRRLLFAYRDVIDRDVYFEITSASGPYLGTNTFETSVSAKALGLQHYATLAPGEQISRDVDLNEYYRLPPGRYEIRAVYQPQTSAVATDAWHGEIRSAAVTLEVR